MRIAALGSAPPVGSVRLRRWDERLVLPATPGYPAGSGLADLIIQPQEGLSLGRRTYSSSDMLARYNVGASEVLVVVVNGRRYFAVQPAVGVGNTIRIFQQATGAFADVRGAVNIPNNRTAPLTLNTADADPDLAWFHELTIRKDVGTDTPGCGFCFGFTSASSGIGQSVYNTGTTPSFGLVGDGAGGFRFGSINAPSGGAARVRTYVDANAVQPAVLVNPGTAEFTVGIKFVPALSASQPARFLCYLNRNLVATFADAANFLLGENGSAARDGQGIVPCLLHDADAAASPRMLVRRWWSFWTNDYSAAHPGTP